MYLIESDPNVASVSKLCQHEGINIVFFSKSRFNAIIIFSVLALCVEQL